MRAALTSLALVPFLLAGCGSTDGTDPAPADATATESSATADAADEEVRVVTEKDADLVLYVSNQSFDDEEVRIEVAIDGIVVVDADFHVEGQHNWVQFPLEMPPGDHQVSARTDSGATLEETFRVPGDDPRFAILDHWGEDESAEITWSFHRDPVAFA